MMSNSRCYTPDEDIPSRIDPSSGGTSFWKCRACNCDVPGSYMVLNETWQAAGIHKNAGQVCIYCLDKRLLLRRGRRLEVADLGKFAMNEATFFFIKQKTSQ